MLEAQDAVRLCRRVRAWAILRDVPVGSVASAVQVSRYHLSHCGSGDTPMSVDLALALCAYTGLDIDGDDVHGPAREGR
jgi:hypothetical protein